MFLSFDINVKFNSYPRKLFAFTWTYEYNVATNFTNRDNFLKKRFFSPANTKSTSSHTSLINMNPHYRGHSSPGYPKSSTKTLERSVIDQHHALEKDVHRSHYDKGSITYRVYVSYFTLSLTYIYILNTLQMQQKIRKKNRSTNFPSFEINSVKP